MKAVPEGPVAHRAIVVAEIHNAGVVDAPDMQCLQRAILVCATACCKTAGRQWLLSASEKQAGW